MQADIWAKRSEAGDIYELDPLLVEEATCTRTAFSTLVDELAHQGHLLVRHNKGLRCKVCNVYRAYRQFRFWSSHPCVPRPSAAAVISLFQEQEKTAHQHGSRKRRVTFSTNLVNATKRPANMTRKNSIIALHWVIGTSRAHTVTQQHFPLPVSLEPELELAHAHQCCDYSLSQTAEQSGESHHVLTKLHGYGMEGKRRRIASFADTGGPRAPTTVKFRRPRRMGHLRFRGGMLTTGRGTSHGPCCWPPKHHVWFFWLFWVLSAICGGKWVRSWEEASYM